MADNKHLPDFTTHMKERAEKLATFLGYVTPSLTSIDMREMYCQGYLQAIQDAKPSRATLAAMCLQGLLANPALTTPSVMETGEWPESAMGPALEAADKLLFHLQNTEK